jgi:hypothetical protein
VSAQPEQILGSDEIAVRAHLTSGRFLAGVAAKRWRLIDLTWPFALIAITAAARSSGPDEWVMRFDLTGYPQQAPTGMPWDAAAAYQLELARYPKGERVREVFRTDWEGGRALYAGYDRVAATAHTNWRTELPRSFWNATRDLTFVLEKLSDLLTSDDYAGA